MIITAHLCRICIVLALLVPILAFGQHDYDGLSWTDANALERELGALGWELQDRYETEERISLSYIREHPTWFPDQLELRLSHAGAPIRIRIVFDEFEDMDMHRRGLEEHFGTPETHEEERRENTEYGEFVLNTTTMKWSGDRTEIVMKAEDIVGGTRFDAVYTPRIESLTE